MTKVSYMENPPNESWQTAKKVPVFQVKCPLLTGRHQTYIGCTKWKYGTWCRVSGKFPWWKQKCSCQGTLISTNTAFDYWLIVRLPDHESVCGATYVFKYSIKKQKILQHLELLHHFVFYAKLKTKCGWYLTKIRCYSYLPFPMQLYRNAISLYYDCSLQLFLVTWTVCQCGPCTHIINNGRFAAFLLSLSARQTEHIQRHLLLASFTIVLNLIVSKPHQLFSWPHTMPL